MHVGAHTTHTRAHTITNTYIIYTAYTCILMHVGAHTTQARAHTITNTCIIYTAYACILMHVGAHTTHFAHTTTHRGTATNNVSGQSTIRDAGTAPMHNQEQQTVQTQQQQQQQQERLQGPQQAQQQAPQAQQQAQQAQQQQQGLGHRPSAVTPPASTSFGVNPDEERLTRR